MRAREVGMVIGTGVPDPHIPIPDVRGAKVSS